MKEAVNFAASVKLPSVMSKSAKAARVEIMLDLFDLRRVMDSKVGDSANPGISGGEKVLLGVLCVPFALASLISFSSFFFYL